MTGYKRTAWLMKVPPQKMRWLYLPYCSVHACEEKPEYRVYTKGKDGKWHGQTRCTAHAMSWWEKKGAAAELRLYEEVFRP